MITQQELEEWNQEEDSRLLRIAEIDAMFEQTQSWESWMVSASNEREQLVKSLRKDGHQIEHKYLARTANGGRVS